jgi:CheY-like chemotaxis protein
VSTPSEHRSTTVAIIEDQQAIAELLAEVLAEAGLRAVTVISPSDAVAEVTAAGARVVLLDVMLPELSGWEVLDRLRADPATRETPVIVISAVYDRPGLHPLPAGGPVRFAPKPFDIRALVAEIRELAE